MNNRSAERLAEVNFKLREKIETIIYQLEKEFSCAVEVTTGFRSHAEQNRLYAQGRTTKGEIVTYAKAGQSFHNHKLAVDICKFSGGKPVWTDEKFWRRAAEIGKSLGLECGYYWKRQDKPHFQLGAKLPKS